MIATNCPGCDGSGYVAPVFAPDVLVNCLSCNEDGSRGASDCTQCRGDGCPACSGFGFVLEPAS